MTKNEYMAMLLQLRSPEAKRLAAALIACSPEVVMEWEARKILIASALSIPVDAIDAAFDELRSVGLSKNEWMN